jgi:fibronectin-binding autotransporter adhesin
MSRGEPIHIQTDLALCWPAPRWVLVMAILLLGCSASYGQMTVERSISVGANIPDRGDYLSQLTWASNPGFGSISSVMVHLTLSSSSPTNPMWLGDMSSVLQFGNSLAGESTRTAVIFNYYSTDWNNSATSLDADFSVDSAFDGGWLASGLWTLVVSDNEQGGLGRLESWKITVSGTVGGDGISTTAGDTVNVTGTNTAITTMDGGTVNAATNITVETYNGGNISNSTAVTINSGSSGGSISGAGSLIKTGSGTLTLSGSNSYTGTTIISNGVVSISTNAAVAGTSGVNLSDGTGLTYTGDAATIDRNISVTSGTGTIRNAGGGTLDLSGSLSKNGAVLTFAGGSFSITGVISGAGDNSDLVVDGAVVALDNTNTYNGPTYIRNAGALVANVVGAMPTDTRSAVIMDDTGTGGSALTNAASQQIASLTGAASSRVALGTDTSLTIGTSTGNTTFAGVISGSGSLTKDGASTQTLSGANTYTGGTTVSAGTLALANASGSALGSTASLNVASGATLLVSQSNQVDDNATVTLSGGTITRGSGVSETFGALTLTGNSFLNFGGVSEAANLTFGTLSLGVYNVSVSGFALNNQLKYAAASEANGLSLLSSFSFDNSYTTSFSTGTGTFTITAIPEPSTYVVALGLLALMLWPLRRRLCAKVS